MTLTAGREGGLQNLEVHGMVTLKIASDKFGRIKVAVRNNDNKGIQLQVWNVTDCYCRGPTCPEIPEFTEIWKVGPETLLCPVWPLLL